jgi:hypothetical protein
LPPNTYWNESRYVWRSWSTKTRKSVLWFHQNLNQAGLDIMNTQVDLDEFSPPPSNPSPIFTV